MAPFNPDWSELEAAQQSLRDHMALVNAAQEREQRFRAEVAAALRELLSTVAGLPVADYSTDGDGAELIKQDAVLKLIDATIAKLGLGGTEE